MSSVPSAPVLSYAAPPSGRFVSGLKAFLRSREIGVFAALAVLVLIVSILRYPAFLTATNMFNLTRQIAFTAIVAIGVLFVILTGGVDLSLGSTVGLTGFLCGVASSMWGAPPLLSAIIGAASGALVGAFNGAIVAYVGVTSFIVTLGMLTAGRSIIYMLNNGANITDVPDVFSSVGNGAVSVSWLHFSVPIPFVILMAVALVCHIVLTYTTFGRRIYAIGGNEEATHLSGINVRAIKFFAYVVCSTLCSITGLLYVGRFRSAVANAGVGLELDAIAAAVIGGTSLMGGTGSVIGVVIGACIMGVVSNAITLLEIRSEAQGMIIGGIIIAAAILDVVRQRKSALAAHALVLVMGLISTFLLLCDFLALDPSVRILFLRPIPLAAAILIFAAAAVQFTTRPDFRTFLAFTRLRPSFGTIVVAVVALALLVYILSVKSVWGIGLVITAVGAYLVIAGLMALIKGQPAPAGAQRIARITLLAAGAIVCLYFLVILVQDFYNDRTILNEQRISTLLVLATVGASAGLFYAALRAMLAARVRPVLESA